jgi:hypothetical protein
VAGSIRVLVLLGVSLLLTSCITVAHQDVAAVTYRLTPLCPAPSARQVVTADEVNAIVSRDDLPAWRAGDIGASARLSDGRLVWVFDDTLRTQRYNPQIVANSILVSSGACVSQLMTSLNGPVIPDVQIGSVVQWPMSVAVLRHDPQVAAGTDVLVVLCARTRRGQGGTLDFQFLGTSAAIFTVASGGVPTLRDVYQVTPDNADQHQVNWGAATAVAGPWFYVYGTRLPTGALGHELYVARAPVADPRARSRWQFWDGRHWQAQRSRAVPVMSDDPGVSQTLSVDEVQGQYVVTSKRGGDLGDFVYTWLSRTPAGPWRAHRALRAPAGFDTGHYEYAPLAHPEVPVAPGHLLVSVSRNLKNMNQLIAHPDKGRPLFAEVTGP